MNKQPFLSQVGVAILLVTVVGLMVLGVQDQNSAQLLPRHIMVAAFGAILPVLHILLERFEKRRELKQAPQMSVTTLLSRGSAFRQSV